MVHADRDGARLLDVLEGFVARLVRDYEPEEILEDLGTRLVDLLGVDGAGVMLEDPDGNLRFATATDDLLRQIEELQIEVGDGPCVRAARQGIVVSVPDTRTDTQFPRFSPLAADRGLCSVHSFPMRLGEDSVGALNVYAKRSGELDAYGRRAGQALTDVATAALLNARAFRATSSLAEHLQRALDSRVAVEQAKGFLAARCGVSTTEAFELLRRAARDSRRKISLVAREVVAGELDLRPG